MGIVWLALDQVEQREVALKRPHSGSGASIRADLEREADIARKVAHPNAIEVLDVVGDGDNCWLVMEYFRSTSLAKLLDSQETLPPQQVARIGAQAADALAAAHAVDVVHRDVTPGNILLGDDGTTKVTDYGIAAWRAATITSSGKINGTAAYVSPEVAEGNGAKAPSDVFSLGATLFAAVEGTPPFGAGDPDVILARIRAGRGEPSHRAGPLTPVLAALLQRDRGARPTAAQARTMLEQAAAGQTVPDWDPPTSGPTKPKRRNLIIAGAAVAVVAILVLAVLRPWETTANDPARTFLGDPRTADPCALAGPEVLDQFGDAQVDANYGGLNRCDVLIDVPEDDVVDVVYEFGGADSDEVTTEQSTIIRHPAQRDDNSCDITVTLADRNLLEIVAKTDDEIELDLCEIATVATDHTVGLLGGMDEIPRRPPADARSIANVDACTLLDDADLAAVPDFAGAVGDPGFANWTCRWRDTGDTAAVQVVFDRGDPVDAREGTHVRLGDRDTYVEEEGYGEGTCATKIFHLRYQDEFGEPRAELPLVVVEGSDLPMDRLCQLAAAFAPPVAAKLPAL